MAIILRYFTKFGSFRVHYVTVVEDTPKLSATEMQSKKSILSIYQWPYSQGINPSEGVKVKWALYTFLVVALTLHTLILLLHPPPGYAYGQVYAFSGICISNALCTTFTNVWLMSQRFLEFFYLNVFTSICNQIYSVLANSPCVQLCTSNVGLYTNELLL